MFIAFFRAVASSVRQGEKNKTTNLSTYRRSIAAFCFCDVWKYKLPFRPTVELKIKRRIARTATITEEFRLLPTQAKYC